jgi:3'-phosphoadenosine 5'-phosphosulfate sulfotransferase (PAPS reductase)/FAD synthetase
MSGDNPQLFTDAQLYNGDPLKPDLETVTPPSVVATLTGPERRVRLEQLIEQAHHIVDLALEEHLGGKQLTASCVLFSGGNDSTVLAHLMRSRVTHAVHANTSIGVEQTRQFVRDICEQWGLPLMERSASKSFRELVLEINEKTGLPHGFPGPAMHYKMFQRLKERALMQVRRELVEDGRKQRVLFIAGRRRAESKRREDIPLHERRGSIVWASPLVMWTKLDMSEYRLMHRKVDPVPVNQVSDVLHMSGECLCGAFAHPGELDEIRMWYPDVADEIDALAADLTAAGSKYPFNVWGHGQGKPSEAVGPLCTSCNFLDLDLGESA